MKNIIIIFLILLVFFLLLVGSQATKKTTETISYSCQRKEPYILEPELMRALNLLTQRNLQNGHTIREGGGWDNCISIEYKDLLEDLGMFYFDKNSSIQKLTIYVDTGYKSSDDLLTSILLSHEFYHIGNFVHKLNGGTPQPCLKEEARAFQEEMYYLLILTDEEKNSIDQKISYYLSGKYQYRKMKFAMDNLNKIVQVAIEADKYCTKYNRGDEYCFDTRTLDMFSSYVNSNPEYQKQCSSSN